MADGIASVFVQNVDSMPLLAHLDELRQRIILSRVGVVAGFLSCLSFADRYVRLDAAANYSSTASPRAQQRFGVFGAT
jgi:Sec-independent protein secretion pathway component TatC